MCDTLVRDFFAVDEAGNAGCSFKAIVVLVGDCCDDLETGDLLVLVRMFINHINARSYHYFVSRLNGCFSPLTKS